MFSVLGKIFLLPKVCVSTSVKYVFTIWEHSFDREKYVSTSGKCIFSFWGKLFLQAKVCFYCCQKQILGAKTYFHQLEIFAQVKNFSRQKYVLALVGNMFPLLEKIVLTHKNMCFCQWQIYFEYWKNRFSRPEYVFLVVKIFFHELKIVFTGKSTSFYYLNICVHFWDKQFHRQTYVFSIVGKMFLLLGKLAFMVKNINLVFRG